MQSEGTNGPTMPGLGTTVDEETHDDELKVLKHAIKALKGNNNELRNDKKQLLAERDEWYAEIKELQDENESLLSRAEALRLENQHCRQDVRDLHSKVAFYESRYKSLVAKYQEVSDDNAALRDQMFASGMRQNPQHTDEYYVKSFSKLAWFVEQNLVGLSADNSGQRLKEKQKQKIFEDLESLGPEGEHTVKVLKTSFPLNALYSRDNLRCLLVRHVAALYLLKRVFEPFALGIATDISDVLCKIINDEKRSIGDDKRKGGIQYLVNTTNSARPTGFGRSIDIA